MRTIRWRGVAVVAIMMIGVMLAAGVASAASLGDVQWSPVGPRLAGSTYKVPGGLLDAIKAEKTTEIVAYNWGDLTWDPATLLNGTLFTQYTGVKVNFVGTPDEQMQPKLQAIFMSRSPAVDVVPLDETLYVNFAKAGWLEPLDFLWDDESWAQFHPSLRQIQTVDGHVYSTPQVARLIDVLFYRPSMLKAAGYSHPPRTWDEFDEMARRLTKDTNGDGVIDQWGFAYRGGGVLDGAFTVKAASLLLGVNPDNYKGSGKVVWNDPKTIEAVERYVKMRNEWKVVPPGVTSYQHGDVADLFLAGKVAMVIDPTYLYARADQSGISGDFGIAVQPLAYEGGPLSQIYHWNGWGVSRFSKNKVAAAAFCDFYRSRQGAVNEFVVENNDFWNLKVLDDPLAKTVGYMPVLQEAFKGEFVADMYLNQGEVYKAVIEEFQKALLGSKSAGQAMNDAQARINRILGQSPSEIKALLSR